MSDLDPFPFTCDHAHPITNPLPPPHPQPPSGTTFFPPSIRLYEVQHGTSPANQHSAISSSSAMCPIPSKPATTSIRTSTTRLDSNSSRARCHSTTTTTTTVKAGGCRPTDSILHSQADIYDGLDYASLASATGSSLPCRFRDENDCFAHLQQEMCYLAPWTA